MQKRADKRTSRKQARKQRKSNRITNVILVICLGVFIFASYKLIQIFLEYKAGSDEYAGLTQYAPTVTLQQTDTATETTAARGNCDGGFLGQTRHIAAADGLFRSGGNQWRCQSLADDF